MTYIIHMLPLKLGQTKLPWGVLRNPWGNVLAFFFLIGFMGCSHMSSQKMGAVSSGDGSGSQPQSQSQAGDSQAGPLPTIEDVDHPLVDLWIRYFQTRGRALMERYLARSTRYGDLMKNILKQNGLPEDLIYVALIESGFSSRATSRAGAVGYWQFIKSTGRRYGLEINLFVDERRDPEKSTQAAAQYFKELYQLTGDWFLALASYNAGEGKILRLSDYHKTDDFWHLSRQSTRRVPKKHRLPVETLHYVPKFLAARRIAQNPAAYGFGDVEYEPPLSFETFKVPYSVDLAILARQLNMDYDELKLLNSRYRGHLAVNYDKGYAVIRLPQEVKPQALAALEAARVSTPLLARLAQDDLMIYRVRRGDSLNTIARRFQVDPKLLKDLNDLYPPRRLRVGMRLDVPRPQALKELLSNMPSVALEEGNQNALGEESIQTYSVQPGDTWLKIARRFEVSVRELKKNNPQVKRLQAGQVLNIPASDRSQATPVAVAPRGDLRSRRGGSPPMGGSRRGRILVASAARRSLASTSKSPATPVMARVHVVKRGESWHHLARRYGLPVKDLLVFNGMESIQPLRPGQRIKIPAERRSPL